MKLKRVFKTLMYFKQNTTNPEPPIPLDDLIVKQILRVEGLYAQLQRCRENRLSEIEPLLKIYDQLAAAKTELSNLQLKQINQIAVQRASQSKNN